MRKFAVVGDVHGQAAELMKLLRRIEADGIDAIFLVGDLVDRGPASVECVRIARTWVFTARNGEQTGLRAVIGNHEENHLYAHYKRVLPGRDFVPKVAHPDVQAALTEADFKWLDSLPHWIGFDTENGKKWAVCHGGLPLNTQCPGWLNKARGSQLCRTGYLDEVTGKPLKPYDWSKRFWANEYDGRWGFVFFGHTSWQQVTSFRNAVGVDCSKMGKIAAVVVSTEGPGEGMKALYEPIAGWTPKKSWDDKKAWSSHQKSLFPTKSPPRAEPPKAMAQPPLAPAGPPPVAPPKVLGTLPKFFKQDDEDERYDSWLADAGIKDPFNR